jgi:acetyl esterase/lipase
VARTVRLPRSTRIAGTSQAARTGDRRRRRHVAAVAVVVVGALLAAACTGDDTDAAPSFGRAGGGLAVAPSAPTSVAPSAPTPGTGPEGAAPDQSGCVGPLDDPVTYRYRQDVGGDEPDLVSLDVHRRRGAGGCPVLVWVHGGGWRRGDKAGRGVVEKAALAGELGAVLVSVNHRLTDPDAGRRWPVMGEDVAAAVAWVLDHAGDLGVDPQRVALAGHSAGAHLASIVATDPQLLAAAGADRADVDCLVAVDSAAFEITHDQTRRLGLYAAAFGDDPAVLAAASPTLQARAHPEGLPDVFVVVRGTPERIAESRRFAAAVRAGGSRAHVLRATGSSHAEVNTRLGAPGEGVVTPPIRRFLRDCLG